MKKISSIVLTLVLLLGAVSCTDLLDESLRGLSARLNQEKPCETDFPDGARLALGFNVPMPVATKAMTDAPTIDNQARCIPSHTGHISCPHHRYRK